MSDSRKRKAHYIVGLSGRNELGKSVVESCFTSSHAGWRQLSIHVTSRFLRSRQPPFFRVSLRPQQVGGHLLPVPRFPSFLLRALPPLRLPQPDRATFASTGPPARTGRPSC